MSRELGYGPRAVGGTWVLVVSLGFLNEHPCPTEPEHIGEGRCQGRQAFCTAQNGQVSGLQGCGGVGKGHTSVFGVHTTAMTLLFLVSTVIVKPQAGCGSHNIPNLQTVKLVIRGELPCHCSTPWSGPASLCPRLTHSWTMSAKAPHPPC